MAVANKILLDDSVCAREQQTVQNATCPAGPQGCYIRLKADW